MKRLNFINLCLVKRYEEGSFKTSKKDSDIPPSSFRGSIETDFYIYCKENDVEFNQDNFHKFASEKLSEYKRRAQRFVEKYGRGEVWQIAFIFNSAYVVKQNWMPNEYKITPGSIEKQIIGIYLLDDSLLRIIKSKMFKDTLGHPEDRVPIYDQKGNVLWPERIKQT